MDSFKQAQLQRDFVPDFSDSAAPIQRNRSLKSGSQACFLAELLLRGKTLTIQDCIRSLTLTGSPSNDAGRRLREARTWIERQGITIVVKEHQKEGVRYNSWRIEPNETLQLAAINKIFQAARTKMNKETK